MKSIGINEIVKPRKTELGEHQHSREQHGDLPGSQ